MWVRQGSPAPHWCVSSASESQPGGHKPAACTQPGCWKLAQCRTSLAPGSRCPQPGVGSGAPVAEHGPLSV